MHAPDRAVRLARAIVALLEADRPQEAAKLASELATVLEREPARQAN